MGKQGLRGLTLDRISASLRRGVDRAVVLTVLAVVPALAGCSSFSSSSTASAPANVSASDSSATGAGYPTRSLVEVFADRSTPSSSPTPSGSPNQSAAASSSPQPRQGLPHPPSSYTASAAPYQNGQPGYDAYAGSAKAAAPAQEDSPTSIAGYPTQSLSDYFSK